MSAVSPVSRKPPVDDHASIDELRDAVEHTAFLVLARLFTVGRRGGLSDRRW